MFGRNAWKFYASQWSTRPSTFFLGGDDDPTAMHLGAFTDAGLNVDTSSRLPRPFRTEP